ncbi:MAG: hypothetical protein ABSG63_05125 [Spirochaetia bacterium]|jgi:hypothetical protein
MNTPAIRGQVCLVNGSLRGLKASSFRFLSRVGKLLGDGNVDITRISVRAHLPNGYPEDTLAAVNSAETVVLAFPLFVYCLPGGFMRFLEEWARHASIHPAPRRTRVYAIVNSGSALPETNEEAIRVIKHFCSRLGLQWRFAIAIGGGMAVQAMAFMDLRLRKAMMSIAADIRAGSCEPVDNIPLKPLLPRILMDTVREYLDRNSLKDASAAISLRQGASAPRATPNG